MKSLALLFLVFLSSLPAAAAEPGEAITPDIARKAIAAFRRDPTSELGRGSAAIIVRFANDSPDVMVTLSPKSLPWMETSPAPEEGPLLLAAFVAGNIRSQLESGTPKDDSLAGVAQLIETYRQLQRKNSALKIPGVEKLIDLQARGKLQDYLDSVDSV